MKYIIKRAIINNCEIAGYEICDTSGKSTNVRVADLAQLINKGLADGDVVVDDNGNKHILFKEINDIEDKTIYTVEYRMIKNNKLTGYICRTDTNEQRKINPSKFWELAAKGNINGVKAVVINNTPTLIGDTIKLSELAVLKV